MCLVLGLHIGVDLLKEGMTYNRELNLALDSRTRTTTSTRVLHKSTALAQNKYLFRHNMALKVLFYEILRDQDLLEEVPPWYSPVMPKPVYKSEQVEAWWDVPVYADHQEVRANRVDARVVNHVSKKVMTVEMSCPKISNREKKSEEKTMKYQVH